MSLLDIGRRRIAVFLTLFALVIGLFGVASPQAAFAAGGGLQGTPFGTSPFWSSNAGYEKVFDGNTGTFFDYRNPNGGYAGIDLGAGNAKVITKIRFHPRAGHEWRMQGGKFQGSNTSPDSGYTDLYTIPAQTPTGWSLVNITDPTPYRYLRYLAPNDAYGNIAEAEFYDADLATQILPTPWQQAGVGNSGATGKATYDNGTFTVSGAGDNCGGWYDQCHIVFQQISGNAQIIARLTGNEAKAGLIIRETLNGWPPAREAIVGRGKDGTSFFEARRQDAYGTDGQGVFSAGANVSTPYWLKLVRSDTTFTGYGSSDGVTWTQLGSTTIQMGASAFFGMATTGKNYNTLATASFDNVRITSGPQPPWSTADIGNTGAVGNATYENGTFTVAGAGDEVGGSYDQFHYVYQPLSGDGQLVARVADIQSTNANTKAALVIRETINGWPPAREAIVGVTKGNSSFFAARTEPEGFANLTAGPAASTPTWLKIVRKGSTFTGYSSSDGITWTQIGSTTINMGADVYIGLAGGGQSFGQLATSTFDNVSFVPSVAATVDWDSIRRSVDRGAYGLNLFNAYKPSEVDAAYNANIAYMNPGAVRYHSWEKMGDSKTTRNGWIDTANKRWDAEKIDAALDNLTGLDPNAAVQINIPAWPSWMDTDNDGYLDADQYDAFAAWCAELVRIVNIEHGHRVVYWEATNERDDIYYVRFKNAGQPDKLDELIDIYNRAALAMKAVDPTIKVGGLAFARGDLYDQVTRFVNAAVAAGTLDYLSMHGYASGDLRESDTQIYNRAASLAKHGADVRAILDAASPSVHIPIWFNEYNISWCFCNNDPRMQNHKGAVFDALSMVYLHDAGVDVTNAWNEKDGIYGKTDGSNKLRPSAHVFHLLNTYALGQRVATTSSNDKAIVTYAVKDEARGIRTYLIINRSSSPQLVQTTFGGWKPKFEQFNRHQISAAGFTTDSISWSSLKADGMIVPDNSVTVLVVGEKPVKPVMECVSQTASGYTAFFGYQNENTVPVVLPVGANNRFSPNPQDRGQITLFQPGRQQRAFSVNFDGSKLTWTLDGRTVTASSGSPTCK